MNLSRYASLVERITLHAMRCSCIQSDANEFL